MFACLEENKSLDAPAFTLLIDPFGIGWQIRGQSPQSPGDFLFGICGHLSILQHVPHRDRPLWSAELCIKWQIAHGQNRERLIDVPFKPVRIIEWMSTTTVGGFLKPRFVFEHRTSLHPFQTVDRLPVMVNQEVLTQSQQSMHHLPWRMVGCVQ